jgi:hypothetical protein
MLKNLVRTVAIGVAVVLVSANLAHAQTNFAQDVNSALDHFLDYARGQIDTNQLGNPPSIDPVGLVGLTLMEKHNLAVAGFPIIGYGNASAADQARLQRVALGIINAGNHVQRGAASFYAYVDGADMMFLSLYARTGGPDPVGAVLTVHQSMDILVDRTLLRQTPNPPPSGTTGLWGYTGNGRDSSTSQYAVGGLAAAKGFYQNPCCGGDPGGRAALIDTALSGPNGARHGYSVSQNLGPAGNEGGWGYQVPGANSSLQQTGSGLWVSVLGGADVNDAAVQRGLHWQQNRYNYQNINSFGDGWQGLSYGYFLFSSSKAYSGFEEQGVAANPGNLSTADIGTLPADPSMGRLAHRDPTTDACALTSFPADCHGSYSAEQPRWYYDYSYTILTRQAAGGSFNLPNGDWDFWSDQAYHALVLERSLGGSCVGNNCIPPTCGNATPSVATLWPINETFQNVSISGVTGSGLTFVINSVMSDEPSNLDGIHFPDANIPGDGTVNLRKDRGVGATNPGNGRVYRVAFTASNAGGMCTGTVDVFAPRNLSTPVVIDPVIWDATIKQP